MQELEEAEQSIIRFSQSQSFDNELKSLDQASLDEPGHEQTPSQKRKNEVTKASSLYRLDPLVDGGLLRLGGRLNHADIPEESKHPVILPRKSHVKTLIIRHTHEQLGHAGRGHVLPKLRERYWIIKANSAVRQLISSCVMCRRIKSTPQDQKMADLPEDRLTPAPPFTYVGVDYFGPYVTKEGRKERKRYGALFTCLVSRTVHIEVAHSLDRLLPPRTSSLHRSSRSGTRNKKRQRYQFCWCKTRASRGYQRDGSERNHRKTSSAKHRLEIQSPCRKSHGRSLGKTDTDRTSNS